MYNNNLMATNGGLKDGKDSIAMKDEEFEEVELTKVLEE